MAAKKQSNRAPLTKSVVALALTKHHGNLAAAARGLGVSRNSIWRMVHRHSDLSAILENLRESMLDDAENALNRAILSGESWAITFFLKTQGRKRGYSSSGSSSVHPLLAQVRQAEADVLASLSQLLLTPKSRTASRMTSADMEQEAVALNMVQVRLLGMMDN